MGRYICIALFTASLFATSAKEAIDEQKEIVKDVQSIFDSQEKELNRVVKLLKNIALDKVETIFELQKQAKLVYLRFLAEAESINIGRQGE